MTDSETRFSEAKLMFDYGFENFVFKEKIEKGDVLKTVPVIKGKKESVNGVAAVDYTIIDNKNEKGEITKEVVLLKDIKAPVEQGQKLGTLYIKKGDSVMAEIDVVAEEKVKHRNIFDVIKLYFQKWLGVK